MVIGKYNKKLICHYKGHPRKYEKEIVIIN